MNVGRAFEDRAGGVGRNVEQIFVENRNFLKRTGWTQEISTQECLLLLQNEGESGVSSNLGCRATSGAPVSKIVEVAKITIAAQNFNWRPRALAPIGADGVMSKFILAGCFSDGGLTQTNFHEK